jgi:pyrroloquinoline quinone (PQQ) biosynthesis protein C
MTAHSFLRHLVAETAGANADFRAIPLVTHTLAHGADRSLYLAFLASAYHHVRHTCPLLGTALSHCGPEDGALRAGLIGYIGEEQGHEAWILDDIAALGGDPRQVAEARPPFAVRMMVAYAYYAIERISPYALLGMVHVLEGLSAALAGAAAGAIRATLGMGETTAGFRYLTSHGTLDQDHVQLFADLLDEIDSPARRTIVVEAARDFYRLYGDVFRSLAAPMEDDHAA